MKTPAQIHKNSHSPVAFHALHIGATFECNGNLWTKKSNRTAVGIWPAILPRWAYFGKNEIVYGTAIRNGEKPESSK